MKTYAIDDFAKKFCELNLEVILKKQKIISQPIQQAAFLDDHDGAFLPCLALFRPAGSESLKEDDFGWDDHREYIEEFSQGDQAQFVFPTGFSFPLTVDEIDDDDVAEVLNQLSEKHGIEIDVNSFWGDSFFAPCNVLLRSEINQGLLQMLNQMQEHGFTFTPDWSAYYGYDGLFDLKKNDHRIVHGMTAENALKKELSNLLPTNAALSDFAKIVYATPERRAWFLGAFQDK